ncbi:MAG: DUF3473 domain-containing protein [Gemmatimonadetes bacterium]|nr:DUF3473 domain-containing protein [Gemmatimonadota bacterium]
MNALPGTTPASLQHHFTVDVEEFFHGTAFEPHVPRSSWDEWPRRSPEVMDRLLAVLDEHDLRATLFIVGWLAELEPDMVRRCAAAGHEIAAHSWDHRVVSAQKPEAFRDSVRRNRALLEDLTGTAVVGFRAPSFSITPGQEWAFDVLIEEGYRYDASLFPIRGHPTYGYPDAPADPHWVHRPAGALVEIPATTLAFGGRLWPASGGAYFRFFPYGYLRSAFEQAAGRGEPATFYIHPWELDVAPTVAAPWRTRLRAFYGLDRTWPRIERLAREYRFRPIIETVDAMEAPDA